MSILIKGMGYNRTLTLNNKSTIVRSPTIIEVEAEE